MLITLRIRNLALVDDLTVELRPGFNVITGETGAGKSILIGALNLLLGGRADRNLIRAGCEQCAVEAVFDVRGLRAPLASFLEENGLEPCHEHELAIKRSFNASGANRQFVNGSPTTLAVLARIGEWLVDIHGPHEHQSLLHPARQLDMLDAYGKLEGRRAEFAALVRRRQSIEAGKAALVADEAGYARQLDLLRFQTNEIATARLQPGEETQLEAEYERCRNAARLLEISQSALSVLTENEPSMMGQAGVLGRLLQELRRLDSQAEPLVELHDQSMAALRELHQAWSRYADKLDADPARLQQLEERLNLLHSLKRKYGSTVAEVIAFGERAAQELRRLESREDELARLNAELAEVDAELEKLGRELSAGRRKAAAALGKAVSAQLAGLGFKQSKFEARLETAKSVASLLPSIPLSGMDKVEFEFAPNPGEPARPLRAIASSGEMARVMLGIKTVLAAEDEVPVLVFDEVDANVGGETARVVGEKMRQIARQRQVLCITHLAPIAAGAQAHFLATKQVEGGRTISRVQLLDRKGRIEELARMLGGGKAAMQHAQALADG